MNIKNLHPATILLATCLLASGASGLITQYICAGISGQLLGNTLKQMAVVVGLMMFGYGVAAIAQANLKKHLIGWFVTIECSLAVLAGLAPLIMQWSYGNMQEHFELIQYSMAFSIGALVGLEIPLVMRINERFVKTLGGNLASTFSWDYIGAAGGSMLYIWLLSRIGMNEIALVTSGINLTIAIITFMYFYRLDEKNVTKLVFGSLALLGTASFLIFASVNQKEWRHINLAKLYDDTVMFSKETTYQQLVITNNVVNDDWRLFINGNLQFSSSDEYIYHENLVHPAAQLVEAQGLEVKNTLILGGGDGIAARELWKYPKMETVTMIDLDAGMTKVFREHEKMVEINGNSLAKTDVINADAYAYMAKNKGDWDVVIVDFPDPNHVDLNKLYTYEFYKNLYNNTDSDVVIAIQSTSPMHAKETYLCVQRTLEAAGWKTLAYHDNVPTFGDWGWFLAWKPSNGLDTADVVSKLASKSEYSVETKYAYPRQFLASTVFGKVIKTDKTSINTNNDPFVVNYYINESEVWF
tara:strand:+ start:944 stop:2521 length:1578 start_codon:yes stop_codon:yes gene_type:complete